MQGGTRGSGRKACAVWWGNAVETKEIQREMLVDLVGIEPTTSSMPWKRAPSCATGPQLVGSTTSILAHTYRLVKRCGTQCVVGANQSAEFIGSCESCENRYSESVRE